MLALAEPRRHFQDGLNELGHERLATVEILQARGAHPDPLLGRRADRQAVSERVRSVRRLQTKIVLKALEPTRGPSPKAIVRAEGWRPHSRLVVASATDAETRFMVSPDLSLS